MWKFSQRNKVKNAFTFWTKPRATDANNDSLQLKDFRKSAVFLHFNFTDAAAPARFIHSLWTLNVEEKESS